MLKILHVDAFAEGGLPLPLLCYRASASAVLLASLSLSLQSHCPLDDFALSRERYLSRSKVLLLLNEVL